MNLNLPVSHLAGVGPKIEQLLNRRNIFTLRDLLWDIPFRYIDASISQPIKTASFDSQVVFEATIDDIKTGVTNRKRLAVIEATVSDSTGSIPVIWFNQPYLTQTLHAQDTKVFVGKVSYDWNKRRLFLASPLILDRNKILPVYHETAGLTSSRIISILRPLLTVPGALDDPLPEEVINKFKLMSRWQALKAIHYPKNNEDILMARRRLGLEELLFLSLQMRLVSQKNQKIGCAIPTPIKDIKHFVSDLPFKLTDSQRKSAWQILKDLTLNQVMKRLLMGDVGSGKTVVGAIASLASARSKAQTLWLAPTTVLANQHFKTLQKLFKKSKISVGLWISANKQADLENNQIIVGTHALLQAGLKFTNVGLIIVDEQHRFGVKQRAALQNLVAQNPHFLSMTATPIPRTLALTMYGDLDISLLDELPSERKKIQTELLNSSQRETAYQKIREQIKFGHQAYVITPLVEDKEVIFGQLFQDDKKSALAEYERLQKNVFPDLKMAVIHGKMKDKEKTQIMDEFKKGLTKILVATAVIEVGIDVPNATVMIIESAESFGLAQLHQFRGRIGRGKDQSHCYLISSNSSPKISQRLEALQQNHSGFALAEIDLKLRGPGSLSGLKQSGFPNLRLALLTDTLTMNQAREAVNMVMEKPLPKRLEEELNSLAQTSHFE